MRQALRFSYLAFILSVSIAACSGDESVTATGSGAGGGAGATTGGGGTEATTGSSSSTGSGSGGAGGTSGQGGGGAGQGGGGAGQGGAGGQGGGSGGSGGAGGSGPVTAAKCFEDDFVNPLMNGPNYDQYGPIVGSHCMGTNHQDITGVERVVFLGDSITVGTPPTQSGDFYRTLLAESLSAKFGLTLPNFLWKLADPFNGTSGTQDSGAFSSCAKWGARTDDLIQDNTQVADCFPASELNKRTLVIMTMGGNDIASLTKDASNGATQADLWVKAMDFVDLMRDAVKWFYEPGRFPNGVYVVFANNYEFTDGTGEVESCDVSALAGFDQPIPAPQELAEIIVWTNEQYLSIAVETGADMIFLLEDFCGHGFNADNPAAPCYRGPGNENWFDLTCIHPNPTGHKHVADMFMAVVNE